MNESDFLNIWGNSVVFLWRTTNNLAQALAWGSEAGCRYPGSPGFGDGNTMSANMATDRQVYYRNAVQYFYMQKFQPQSYTDNSNGITVNFNKGLVSSYNAANSVYTLTQTFSDRAVTYANGVCMEPSDLSNDVNSTYARFLPQVGAGCTIIAYSKVAQNNATWTLPPTWDGITSVDRYVTSLASAPVKLDTLTVGANHTLTFNMGADTGYVLVPHGNAPTPVTTMFNDLTAGSTVTSYSGITWNVAGNPALLVWQADSAGGFSSNSVRFDSESTGTVAAQISLPLGDILDSLCVGNFGGTGTILLHSSTPGNADMTFALPSAGQTALLETNWRWAEIGNLTIDLTNSGGCWNTPLDNFMYSVLVPEPSGLTLTAIGLIGVLSYAWRKRRQKRTV